MAVPNFQADLPSWWSSGVKNLGKVDILPSCDTLWRFRSKFNPLIPKHGKHHRKVIVMGSFMRVPAKSSPTHWRRSRMVEVCFQPQPFISPSERVV